MCHWTWPICRWLSYPLVMTNSSPWYRWPIEMDGLPSYKMVIFHGKLLVITRGYLKWWSFTSQQLPGGTPYPHQADRDRNQHPQQLIHNWGNKGGLLISLKRFFFFVIFNFLLALPSLFILCVVNTLWLSKLKVETIHQNQVFFHVCPVCPRKFFLCQRVPPALSLPLPSQLFRRL